MNKKQLFALFSLAIFFTVPALRMFAAEIFYPPFFAIDKATSIGDFVKIFFSGALGIGAVIAAVYVVLLGFQILQSRGNPTRIVATRNRITKVLVGLALLAGGILILRTINPELTIVASPPFNFVLPSSPPKGPGIPSYAGQGQKVASYPLGRILNATNTFLNHTDPDPALAETEDTLITLTNRVAVLRDALANTTDTNTRCNQNLCEGPGTPTSYTKPATGHNIDPVTGKDTPYNYCAANSCSTDSCNGINPSTKSDPCSQRTDAIAKLNDTVQLFTDLQDFWKNTIQPERNLIENCVVPSGAHTELFDYASAQHIAKTQYNQSLSTMCAKNTCRESEDFFCTNLKASHFTLIHLSLNEPQTLEGLMQKEQKFIDNVNGIITDINSCSCTSAQYYCPGDVGDCSYGSGTCIENTNPAIGVKGCTPDMWQTALPDLIKVVVRMQTLHDQLYAPRSDSAGALENIDGYGLVIEGVYNSVDINGKPDDPNNYFYFGTCLQTQSLAKEVPNCSTNSSECCPDASSRADIHQCVVEDFYGLDCVPNTK